MGVSHHMRFSRWQGGGSGSFPAETGWFNGDVKPVNVGSYKTRNNPDARGKRFIRLNGGSNFVSRRWWDGQQWLQYEGGPPSIMGSVHHQWCGLTGKVK